VEFTRCHLDVIWGDYAFREWEFTPRQHLPIGQAGLCLRRRGCRRKSGILRSAPQPQLLGLEKLETSAIYTQVSIEQLKADHSQTHPAEQAKIRRDKPPETA